MGATTLSNDFRSLSRQPPTDPDIQATLSDFLTYTDHFPSHLTRALSLIEGQRRRAERKIQSIHEDTVRWSMLPSLKEDRPDPVALRRNISYALEEAERASRMAVEEASRLEETCAREAKRLDTVVEKLKAQPMPPSRDPTPEPQALSSPTLKREWRASSRRDEARSSDKAARRMDDRAATKLRGRKIMVPGEVLPPPDPDVPLESMSEWTSPSPSPPPPLEDWQFTERERKPTTPRHRSRTPRHDRERKQPKARISRTPGQPGTNAHSAVAGISTSNALLALTQPPDDAIKGSKWYPWMALTEWEMAKLRKRMKKNAIWVPSQTMVRRELKNLGRGIAGKEAARREAEVNGTEFMDETSHIDPTKTVLSGEEPAHATVLLDDKVYDGGAADDEDQELINRGMRLNEAKKLKRQRMLEEQALQAQIAREQGGDSPSADVKTLASAPDVKKRKRESTPTAGQTTAVASVDPADSPKPALKKIRGTAPSTSIPGTTKVPLGPPGVSSSPRSSAMRNRRTVTPPPTRQKATLVLKANKAVSEEPPNRRATLRRGSNVSLPNGSSLTSPARNANANKPGTSNSRRTRRPAPGILTTADEDSAKVGVSKRKAAPRKKSGGGGGGGSGGTSLRSTSEVQESVQDEDIDPDEPRYCLCGDVSWGTMIACDNDDCEKEWFHLSCVNLEELPPRRTKWFCPDCRKKLKMGTASNGLVGRTTAAGGR